MNTKELKEFIDEVYKIYIILDWKWLGKEVTKRDIKNKIIELIDGVKKDKYITEKATGGLYARREYDGDVEFIKYGFHIEKYYEI